MAVVGPMYPGIDNRPETWIGTWLLDSYHDFDADFKEVNPPNKVRKILYQTAYNFVRAKFPALNIDQLVVANPGQITSADIKNVLFLIFGKQPIPDLMGPNVPDIEDLSFILNNVPNASHLGPTITRVPPQFKVKFVNNESEGSGSYHAKNEAYFNCLKDFFTNAGENTDGNLYFVCDAGPQKLTEVCSFTTQVNADGSPAYTGSRGLLVVTPQMIGDSANKPAKWPSENTVYLCSPEPWGSSGNNLSASSKPGNKFTYIVPAGTNYNSLNYNEFFLQIGTPAEIGATPNRGLQFGEQHLKTGPTKGELAKSIAAAPGAGNPRLRFLTTEEKFDTKKGGDNDQLEIILLLKQLYPNYNFVFKTGDRNAAVLGVKHGLKVMFMGPNGWECWNPLKTGQADRLGCSPQLGGKRKHKNKTLRRPRIMSGGNYDEEDEVFTAEDYIYDVMEGASYIVNRAISQIPGVAATASVMSIRNELLRSPSLVLANNKIALHNRLYPGVQLQFPQPPTPQTSMAYLNQLLGGLMGTILPSLNYIALLTPANNAIFQPLLANLKKNIDEKYQDYETGFGFHNYTSQLMKNLLFPSVFAVLSTPPAGQPPAGILATGRPILEKDYPDSLKLLSISLFNDFMRNATSPGTSLTSLLVFQGNLTPYKQYLDSINIQQTAAYANLLNNVMLVGLSTAYFTGVPIDPATLKQSLKLVFTYAAVKADKKATGSMVAFCQENPDNLKCKGAKGQATAATPPRRRGGKGKRTRRNKNSKK